MGSIHQRLDTRSNLLNFLRLVLAALVIVSNAAPVGGFANEMVVSRLTIGNISVGGFSK